MPNNTASIDINAHVDHFFGELRRARVQNLADFPSTAGAAPGWVIYHTALNSAFVWTGQAWLDLGQTYTHPTYTLSDNPFQDPQASGLKILSQLLTNATGHVVKIASRELTNADILSIFLNDAVQSGTFTWSSNKIKAFVENAIGQSSTGALVYQPSPYTPATAQGSLVPPVPVTSTSIKAGMVWVVAAAGWMGTQKVDPGDMAIAKVDNAGAVEANWQVVNKNIEEIVQATEAVAGIMKIATAVEVTDGVEDRKAVTPKTLKMFFDQKVGGFMADFGDGSSTSFTFQHNLGTENLHISVRRNADGKVILCDTRAVDTNKIAVNVLVPLTVNEYRVVVMAKKS